MPLEVVAGVGEVAAGVREGISSNQRAERPTYRAQRLCGTTSVWHIIYHSFIGFFGGLFINFLFVL